jgi:hypothetical protein
MKALSLKQPWANLVAAGRKTIETRTWRTEYRGPILIVSSQQPRIAPAGFAVALVELADCRPMTPADEPAACCPVYPGAFAWVLRNVRPVVPFRVLGRLRIFDVTIPRAALKFLPRRSRA